MFLFSCIFKFISLFFLKKRSPSPHHVCIWPLATRARPCCCQRVISKWELLFFPLGCRFLRTQSLTSWSHSISQSRLVLTTPSIRHQGAQRYQVLDTYVVYLLSIPPLECFLSSFLKGRFMLHRQRVLPHLFPSPVKVSFTFIELVLIYSHVHGCVPCLLRITARSLVCL